MGVFFRDDHEKLDDKIAELAKDIDSAYYILSTGSDRQWDAIMKLMGEIQQDFRSTKYPTKQQRDTAWQTFCSLRNDAYAKKQRRFEKNSADHHRELMHIMAGLEYWSLTDGLEIAFFKDLQVKKDEIIQQGKITTEAANRFKEVKHEMIGEHKTAVHNRIVEIRESHNEFFEDYRLKNASMFNERQEKHREYEERSQRKEQAKRNLEDSVEANKERLRKAENALSKQQSHLEHLDDQLSTAYSESFKSRCEEWIAEANNTISDIETSIDKIRGWISDGEDRLREWR